MVFRVVDGFFGVEFIPHVLVGKAHVVRSGNHLREILHGGYSTFYLYADFRLLGYTFAGRYQNDAVGTAHTVDCCCGGVLEH